MYCGIINSVTKWHLVGYCYWVILRCTDPWILNLPLWSPKVKNLWWYTSNPPTYHHDTGTVPIPFGGLSAEHMPKFSLVTTQPPQRGGTKKNLNASLWTRNSAVCTSAASTPEYRTSHFLCKHGTVYNIICIMTSQTLIQRVSFTARQNCRALASPVASQQRCRQHYRGQYGDNKTYVLVREAGLNNRMSSQNSNIQGYSSTYVTHHSTNGRYQFYVAMTWGPCAVVQRTEVAIQHGTSNRD